MIIAGYRVAPSAIPGAGNGVFLSTAMERGRVIVAPDAIPRTWTWQEIIARPDASEVLPSSVRWFEDHYTVTPDWPDECFINHAFQPTGIWHLGFVFAGADLSPGTELTVDYRHLLGEGQQEAFRDALTGEPIIGWSWSESVQRSTAELAAALRRRI